MAKKRKEAEDNSQSGGSVVLFTSLMIILLAFFILLNSIAVIDDERRLTALGSFIGAFGILPSGVSPIKGEGRSLYPSPPMEAPMEGLEMVEEFIKNSSMPSAVAIGGGRLRKVITIHDAVLFDQGGYRLKPEGRAFLKEVARFLNLNNYPVRIEGHTDDALEPPAGVASDWDLSAKRALMVLRFLVEVGHVASPRLSAFGYGKHRPLAPNNSQLNRAKNRRVSLVLDAREEALKDDLEDRLGRPKVFGFKGFLFQLFRRP